jgi:hypothetical protein
MNLASLPDSVAEIPRLTDPAALGAGMRAVVRLPKDRYTTDLRAGCIDINPRGKGVVEAAITGHGFDGIVYRLRLVTGQPVIVEAATITDSYRAFLLAGTPPATLEELAAEETRLRNGVRFLAPGGWQPAIAGD